MILRSSASPSVVSNSLLIKIEFSGGPGEVLVGRIVLAVFPVNRAEPSEDRFYRRATSDLRVAGGKARRGQISGSSEESRGRSFERETRAGPAQKRVGKRGAFV